MNNNKPRILFSARLTLALILMFATWSSMFHRLSINFGLVCMVKTPTINDTSSALEADNGGINSGEFEWTRQNQGQILGAFYIGLVLSQLPGGWTTDRFGAKRSLMYGILALGLLTALTPICSAIGPGYLVALRFLGGVVNGATMPAISVLSSHWFPDVERGLMLGIAYSGLNFATAMTYPISAFFCEVTGWRYLFYFSGIVGILFFLLTSFLVFDWPEKHSRVSISELEFIKKHRAVQHNGATRRPKIEIPWRNILTSIPVWTLNISNFCCFWLFLTIGIYLPTYFKEVLHQDISQNGILSSIPFVATLIFHFVIAIGFDWLRKQNKCSITNLRKIFNTVGTMTAALSTLAIGLISEDNITGAIFLITCGQVFVECAIMGGYTFSIFEVAPKYASTLTALMNTFGLAVGLVSPMVVTYLTPDGTGEQWLTVFYISAAISAAGGFVYLIFGTAELQPWAANSKAGDKSLNKVVVVDEDDVDTFK